jgi:outer membrane protein TolC
MLFLLFSVGTVFGAGNYNETRMLGLKYCIDLAIDNDPDINDALNQGKIGRISTNEAFKDLILPKLDFDTLYGPKLDFFGRPVEDDNRYLTRVTFEKPLYKGGELITNYRLGKSETKIAAYDFRQKIMEVTEDTIVRYYELLSSQENVRYHIELRGQAEQTVELLKKKFQIGAVTRIEVLEAESKLSEIQYRLVKAHGDLQNAIGSLNERLGLEPDARIGVIREFPLEPLNGNIDTLISEALDNRPDLLYQKENVRFRRLQVSLNKSKRLPTLSLLGTYAWEGDDFPGKDRDWAVLLNFSISLEDTTLSSSYAENKVFENRTNRFPFNVRFDETNINLSVFDGSSNKVDLERARASKTLEADRLEQLKITIIKEVREAANKIQEAEATIAATRKSVEFAEEKLKILEEKLKLGETTEIEVLESRVELVDVRVKNLQALFEHSTAIAGLYKALGRTIE